MLQPWESVHAKGRRLEPGSTLAGAGVAEEVVVAYVRRELIAEGWKLRDKDETLEVDSDEEGDTRF